MKNTTQVLAVILPVIVMVALGMGAKKWKILSQKGVDEIKSVLINICLPAVVFRTFYSTEFTWEVVTLVLMMAAVTFAAYELGRVVSRLLHIPYGMAAYLCTSIEGGMMGYALFILLFGQDNLYHLAFLDLGNTLIVFPVLLTKLRMRSHSGGSRKDILQSLFSPVNIAILSGILLSVSGIGKNITASAAGDVLNSILSFVSAPTSALILLAVGFGLSFSDVPWTAVLKTVLARIIIYAVFGFIVFRAAASLFPEDRLYQYGVVMAFILPPSYAYTVFAEDGEETAYTGAVLALYTILTIIGYCVLAALSS